MIINDYVRLRKPLKIGDIVKGDDLLDYASKNKLSIKFEDKHGVPYRGVVLAKTPNGNYIIGDEMDRLVIVAYLDPDNSNFCNVRLCLFED